MTHRPFVGHLLAGNQRIEAPRLQVRSGPPARSPRAVHSKRSTPRKSGSEPDGNDTRETYRAASTWIEHHLVAHPGNRRSLGLADRKLRFCLPSRAAFGRSASPHNLRQTIWPPKIPTRHLQTGPVLRHARCSLAEVNRR
jgi:hypothetical protein